MVREPDPAPRAMFAPDLLAGRRPRTINMVTIGDDLLRQSREVLPDGSALGPKIEAVVVYNSNPVAVAPQSARLPTAPSFQASRVVPAAS